MANGTYRINFNANQGSGGPSYISGNTVYDESTESYLARVQLPSTKPSRTYYNFLGWSANSSSTSASYSAGGYLAIVSETSTYVRTLYAVWQHQTAYVYYNANGGSGAPSTQSHWAGYSITLSSTVPTRTGYKFLGWATSASATTAQYQPNTSQALYTTTTLYAVWELAASTLTVSNGTIGTALSIGINRNNSSYTDTITYKFGSATGTITTKTSSSSVSWTPPLSLASEIPNASTGTCTLTCTTYNGSTVIGTTTKSITLTVPQSLAPTVSVSYADTIAQCLTWGLLVQSRSKLAFTITASGQQGATIASYSTSVNGTSYNSASFTTDVLLYNGSNSYTVTVTDSRGLQTVSTGTFSVVAYSNPSLTLTLCDRNDSDPDQVDIGFDFSVASVSSNNDAKYRLDYKLKSASTWTNGTVQNLGAYSGSISDLIANLDGGDEWDIRINVIDSFQTASVESEVGVAGNILLNSRHNGGLGLLMKSQADNQLDIGKPTVHHGAVLEQFGSTVASHTASGNYAKVVTFSTDVTVGKNLLNPIIYQGGSYNAAIGTQWTLTQSATQLTKNGSTFTISLGSWSSRLFVVQVNEGTTYHVKAVLSGDNIATTKGFLSSSYEVMTVHNVTGASVDIDVTITPTTGQAYYYILFAPRNSTQTITIESPQLEVGSTATAYEPYRDASDLNINAPITLEYIRSTDTSPTRLTINFNRNYSLASFTSDGSSDAYLHNSSTAHWDLYIGKNSSSDSVEILDFHNPWSNTDMTIDWDDTSVSTLPTGYVSAMLASIPNTYGDLLETGQRIYVYPSNINLTSGAYKTVASVTLPKGIWLLMGTVQFNSNSSGNRTAYFATSSDSSTDMGAVYKDLRSAVNGEQTYCKITAYYTATASSTTLYLVATQNSGSTISTAGRIMAVKIA